MSEFSYAERGMTRFPPNVEQITIAHETGAIWLVVRRNDLELRFPLNGGDCHHLAALLVKVADASSSAKNASPAS
jgi:hypothetical protein